MGEHTLLFSISDVCCHSLGCEVPSHGNFDIRAACTPTIFGTNIIANKPITICCVSLDGAFGIINITENAIRRSKNNMSFRSNEKSNLFCKFVVISKPMFQFFCSNHVIFVNHNQAILFIRQNACDSLQHIGPFEHVTEILSGNLNKVHD